MKPEHPHRYAGLIAALFLLTAQYAALWAPSVSSGKVVPICTAYGIIEIILNNQDDSAPPPDHSAAKKPCPFCTVRNIVWLAPAQDFIKTAQATIFQRIPALPAYNSGISHLNLPPARAPPRLS